MSGALLETYAAAIQHDIADLPADATKVGVVRRPTGWFRALVDENVPAVAPPGHLIDEVKERHEDLKTRGMCDEEAHNAAWDEVSFDERYREHLRDDEDAAAEVANLVDRVESGETIVLVCFEGENKRCHRHRLLAEIRGRLADGEASVDGNHDSSTDGEQTTLEAADGRDT